LVALSAYAMSRAPKRLAATSGARTTQNDVSEPTSTLVRVHANGSAR
jgi:hypothetical protein